MSEVQSVCEQEELRWAEELDTYEKGTKFTDRNRMRKDYTLSYPGLFPYHEALYPLLDYYYHIPNDPGWMQIHRRGSWMQQGDSTHRGRRIWRCPR